MDNVDDALEQQQIEREQHDQQTWAHELLRIVDFGLQVRQFLGGEIGRRILTDTEHETTNLLKELADLDPDDEADRKLIRVVRQKLGILAHWQNRFAAYIEAGKAAEVELNKGEQFTQEN